MVAFPVGELIIARLENELDSFNRSDGSFGYHPSDPSWKETFQNIEVQNVPTLIFFLPDSWFTLLIFIRHAYESFSYIIFPFKL